MAVYLIASVEVLDSAGYEEYRRSVPSTIAEYGGRYLARGGAWSDPRFSRHLESVFSVRATLSVIGV